LLAVLALPALAGATAKGSLTACAANLHQIGVATMLYANDFGGRLPPNGNTRTVFVGGSGGYKVPKSFALPVGNSFRSAGYFYPMNLVGDGEVLAQPSDCPAVKWVRARTGIAHS
jgi:hypothetical protein